nr:MAG TPA: hypothetical protein [Caudoviricetes sp.]
MKKLFVFLIIGFSLAFARGVAPTQDVAVPLIPMERITEARELYNEVPVEMREFTIRALAIQMLSKVIDGMESYNGANAPASENPWEMLVKTFEESYGITRAQLENGTYKKKLESVNASEILMLQIALEKALDEVPF